MVSVEPLKIDCIGYCLTYEKQRLQLHLGTMKVIAEPGKAKWIWYILGEEPRNWSKLVG